MSRRTLLFRKFKKDTPGQTADHILTINRRGARFPMKEEKAIRIARALHRKG